MDQYHKPHTKKVAAGTGGKRLKIRDKKRAHIGGSFCATKVSDNEVKKNVRERGGNRKLKIKKAIYVNIGQEKGSKKLKIKRVLESHNPEYVRMNIITRGAVVETEMGKVRITNRVGQDGVVNGTLVK